MFWNPDVSNPYSVLCGLHKKCSNILNISLSEQNQIFLGKSYVFINDLEAWQQALPEHVGKELITTATSEYILALLNVCQGQYRNGFKGLRLVLELCLQHTYLSANILLLEEWLRGDKDTCWATLIDEESGPLDVPPDSVAQGFRVQG